MNATPEPTSPETPQQSSRRRRRRGQRRRGLYLLPHLLTTANLFFGFYAIVQAFTGKPDMAALGIILAGVCDALDGRVARLARTTSRFGVEYDSIADTVSFGVAPAMLAFSAGQLQVLGRPGWVLAFLFTACAALRLARFNVTAGRYKGRFEGMPSPAAAGMVASTQWFVSFLREHGVAFSVPEWAVAGGVALLGLLMVSAIPYRSFKELDLRHSFGTLVLAVVALALVVQEPSVTLFVIGIVYVSAGPVEWVWRRATGSPLEKLSEPVPSEPSQG
ncbi:MAG: CDP-diacylglycerol--serine O-phosphatidyltransferase [Deltaproteobacteria bacterium]|nr:CDP-diacylglycerol--serine O-phosphatidyltransferase [Deltaproteobacteria bacterium]